MFWQVTGNNPMVLDVTDVIDTYVTRSLFESAGVRNDQCGGSVSVGIFVYSCTDYKSDRKKKVENRTMLYSDG